MSTFQDMASDLQDFLTKPRSPYGVIVYQSAGRVIARDFDGKMVGAPVSQAAGNASTVIQSALDYLTEGGSIFVKRGTYKCNTQLTVSYDNTEIIGESVQNTVLDFSNVAITDALAGNGKAGLAIENLKFKSSNGQTHNAIRLIDGNNFWRLRNLYFENFDGSTILLRSQTATGIGYGKADNIIVITPGNTGAGIGIGLNLFATTPGFVNGNEFSKTHVIGASWGVAMQDTGAVANNKFFALSVEQGSIGVRILNANAYDNLFDYHPDGGSLTSAWTVTASDGNVCMTDRAAWADGVADDGKTAFKGNQKVGNNLLSATFDIANAGVKTVTIAHGLAYAPSLQQCVPFLVKNTDVDDWSASIHVHSADANNVILKVNVTAASATGGATAKVGLRVGSP